MNKYDNILEFYENYIKLEQVIRKGWLMNKVPVKRLESVADHTLQLIMLASILTKELKIDINLERLTDMLLIHDFGESIVGDISDLDVNIKTSKEKEKEAIKDLLSGLDINVSNYYLGLYNEMEEKSTKMAVLAYSIDKLDAVIKAGIYEKQNNLEGLFKEFYNNQVSKGTFENDNILKEFFDYLNTKYCKTREF